MFCIMFSTILISGQMLTETVEALQRRYLERQIEFYRYRLPVHPWAFR